MILLNIRRAAISLVALGALTVPCLAQQKKTFVLPHVLERDGRIVAIGWDLTGGQAEFKWKIYAPLPSISFSRIGALYSLYGNDEIFQMVADSLAGRENGNSYSIYSLQKGIDGQNLAVTPMVSEVRFPACDAGSKEPAGMEVYFNPRQYTPERVRTPQENKVGAEIAKKQKTWTSCNFRIRIGDLPCSRVSKVTGPKVITTILGSDGSDVTVRKVNDIEITIPLEDAGPFREALRSTIEGTPKTPTLLLEYLDEDGTVLLAIEMVVSVVSVDKENPLDPFDPSDTANKEKPVRVSFTGVEIVIKK